ncbi:hypothetical protein B0H12DRAFT_192901 [Mycena haematopus]|nr:hypothetical protein B0H12DRAFT_192901 [Mycena haematopus]
MAISTASPSANDAKPVVADASAEAPAKTEAAAPAAGTGSPTAAQAPKRRAARRANTAERRATHNAVERMRRETLNGRFLTLAGLLPPLAALRRPSKAAIVSSSIATVNAARRHRVLAAQTLRALAREAEQLRREVNEWRTRARVPQLDVPARSDAHHAVLRAELEDFDLAPEDGMILEEDEDFDGAENDDGQGGESPVSPQPQAVSPKQEERFSRARSASASVPGSAHGFPRARVSPPGATPSTTAAPAAAGPLRIRRRLPARGCTRTRCPMPRRR